MHKQDAEGMRKSEKHRDFMHLGLAFEQGGRELLDFWGGFGFWGQELGYTVVFWRRVQLVVAIGETQLYTKCNARVSIDGYFNNNTCKSEPRNLRQVTGGWESSMELMEIKR